MVQLAFFAAVHELSSYVGAQLQMISLIEGCAWHEPPGAAAAFGGTPLCDEVITLLQALVLAQAPETHSFSTWLTLTWQRSVVDIARGDAPRCASFSFPSWREVTRR